MKKIYIVCLLKIMSFGTTVCMYQELVRATRLQQRFELQSKKYVRDVNNSLYENFPQGMEKKLIDLLLWNEFCLQYHSNRLSARSICLRLYKKNKSSIAYRKKLHRKNRY